MKEKESWFRKLLIRLGLIVPVEVDRKAMCKKAQKFCSYNCNFCVWKGSDEDVD